MPEYGHVVNVTVNNYDVNELGMNINTINKTKVINGTKKLNNKNMCLNHDSSFLFTTANSM